MSERLPGHTYRNTANFFHWQKWEVVPIDPPTDNLPFLARDYQAVMQAAWTSQFAKTFSAAQIAATVNPRDSALLQSQTEKLAQSGGQRGPWYAHARFQPPEFLGVGTEPRVIGIGKAAFADPRSRWQRQRYPDPPLTELWADVGNLFVTTDLKLGNASKGLNWQHKGVGVALLRSLLDNYAPETPTAAYEYPQLNAPAVAWLGRLSFAEVERYRRPVPLFDTQVEQALYLGPPVGDVIDELENLYPHVRQRTPREA